jgi:hypothetical protein
MGGFIPAALAAHGILQQIKPVTNGEKLVQALGWDKAINRGLDRLGPVGSAIRGIGSLAKGVLGYGHRRRRHRVHRKKMGGRRRRHHHRRLL